jgi:Bacterial signalling protein N terminal repeat
VETKRSTRSCSKGHDPYLVALSVAIAILGGYTGFGIVGRIRGTPGVSNRVLLGGAAAFLAVGIWTMHFVGMLAAPLPRNTLYLAWEQERRARWSRCLADAASFAQRNLLRSAPHSAPRKNCKFVPLLPSLMGTALARLWPRFAQCSRNTPSMARSSAGLISRECATVTE